jgi:hypothetical protein
MALALPGVVPALSPSSSPALQAGSKRAKLASSAVDRDSIVASSTVDRDRIVAYLVDDIANKQKMHTTSGILGIKYVLEVLADEGRGDVALAMLLQTDYPSYGFMVKGGEHGYEPATTLWELWNSDTGSDAMDSRNHIMVSGAFWRHLRHHFPHLTSTHLCMFPLSSLSSSSAVSVRSSTSTALG